MSFDGYLGRRPLEVKDKETERLKKDIKQMTNTCIQLREQLRIKGERLNKYEEPGQECNRGHKNILPIKLWNCPICTDPLREEMEKLKKEKEWMLDVLAEHYIDEVDPYVTECEARDGIVKEMHQALKEK